MNMTNYNPIHLVLNDVFQVKSTGNVFQIIYQNQNTNIVKFVNIDDREKINTVSFNQFQKAYDAGKFNLIATNLR